MLKRSERPRSTAGIYQCRDATFCKGGNAVSLTKDRTIVRSNTSVAINTLPRPPAKRDARRMPGGERCARSSIDDRSSRSRRCVPLLGLHKTLPINNFVRSSWRDSFQHCCKTKRVVPDVCADFGGLKDIVAAPSG